MVHARAKAVVVSVVILGWLLVAPSTAQAATTVSAAEQETILALHNQYRAAAGVAPLVWDDQLAADAQTWVDALVARGGTLAHSNPADPDDPAPARPRARGRTSRAGSPPRRRPPSGTRRSRCSTPPRTSPGSTTRTPTGSTGVTTRR